MASRPQSRNERVSFFCLFEIDFCRISDSFRSPFTCDNDLPDLIFALGQVPADKNLLSPRSDIRQPLGINSSNFQPTEFHVDITQARLSDLVQQLFRNNDCRLLTPDAADRATTDRRDPFKDGRFADIADTHRME